MRNFTSERFWYIKHIHVFRDLAETDTHALAEITSYKNLKHEERIGTEGVYLIKEGRVKIAKNTSNATSKKSGSTSDNTDSDENNETEEVLEQGEIFGIVSNDKSILDEDLSSFTETLSEVCLGVVTIRDFSYFLKRKPHLILPIKRRVPNFFKKVNDTFTTANNKNENWHYGASNILIRNTKADKLQANSFGNIAFRTASSRLALLLQNHTDTPDGNGVVLVSRLSKKRISTLIGSSTETIETLLDTFKQYYVIKKRRGRIQILNPWMLKKIADARMKTLTPLPVSETTSEDDFGLELLANLSNEGNNQTDSTVSKT